MAESPVWFFVRSHPVTALAAVLLLDGVGIPLFPEIATLGAFFLKPSLLWAIQLVLLVTAVEVAAAFLIWATLGLTGVPRWLSRFMNGYAGSLLVSDERLILLNRAVPVLPVVGAFVRVRGWRPGRSFAFLAIGAATKYGLLLAASYWANRYFSSSWAPVVGLSLAGAFLLTSWVWALRKWILDRRERDADAPVAA